MRRMLAALLLVLPLAVRANTAVLSCGHLFDSETATLLGPHTITVVDDRIEAVKAGLSKAGRPHPKSEDAALIFRDFSAHTCLPGLIDMHVHLDHETSPTAYNERFRLNPEDFAFRSVGYAERTLLAGFTTVRDLGGTRTLALRDAINAKLLRGPRIIAAGKSIATTGGHADPVNGVSREQLEAFGYPGPEDGVISGPIEARRAVRQRYKEGADVIKLTATGGVLSVARSADNPQFMLDEIEAIVATAHDYGFKVAAHAHGKEGMKRAVLGGVDSIEHGTYMDDEVIALIKQHGTWYVPTLTAGAFVGEKAKLPDYYPEIVRPKAERVSKQIHLTVAKAVTAGVKIAFGTDAGVFPHGQNAREFELLVEAGLTPELALQSATRNAAELLGMADQIGSIRAGKLADVVAVEGNPVQDIRRMQRMTMVMKGGVIYP